MKKYIIFLFFLTVNYVYGQNDTTAKMMILAGGSTNFHFNSYTKINNGITYSSTTRFRVSYVVTDGLPAFNVIGADWKLSVRANTNNIVGDDAPNFLDLATVRVMAEAPLGTGVWQTLTNADVVIVNSNSWNTQETITISYECGVPPGCTTILGESTDFYFTDLIFTLEAQ